MKQLLCATSFLIASALPAMAQDDKDNVLVKMGNEETTVLSLHSDAETCNDARTAFIKENKPQGYIVSGNQVFIADDANATFNCMPNGHGAFKTEDVGKPMPPHEFLMKLIN